MKREMADCLALWTQCYGSDFHKPWNLCSDETTFTDDEGREPSSLLDDLVEAKRHNSTDDIDNDMDSDCISLWDDGRDEQWTTKDVNSGPTLAELNGGGELTDLEKYKPLQVGKTSATKRKRQHSRVDDAFHQSSRRSTVSKQTCDMRDQHLSLQTVQCNRSLSIETHVPFDKEGVSLSLCEERIVKGCQNVSLPHTQTVASSNICIASDHMLPSCLKHTLKLESPDSAHEFHATKKIKTHHRGPYLLFIFRGFFALS